MFSYDVSLLQRFPQWHGSDEEFEILALLDSVTNAARTFTMIEAGAGYGRWTQRAWEACKMLRQQAIAKFYAIEAEPSHFQMLKMHLANSGIPDDSLVLTEAALVAEGDHAHFTVGHAEEMVRSGSRRARQRVW